jgi:hypothetical protein
VLQSALRLSSKSGAQLFTHVVPALVLALALALALALVLVLVLPVGRIVTLTMIEVDWEPPSS